MNTTLSASHVYEFCIFCSVEYMYLSFEFDIFHLRISRWGIKRNKPKHFKVKTGWWIFMPDGLLCFFRFINHVIGQKSQYYTDKIVNVMGYLIKNWYITNNENDNMKKLLYFCSYIPVIINLVTSYLIRHTSLGLYKRLFKNILSLSCQLIYFYERTWRNNHHDYIAENKRT